MGYFNDADGLTGSSNKQEKLAMNWMISCTRSDQNQFN